jgi:cysteine desulfurase family protein
MRKNVNNLIYFDNSSTSYPKAPGVADAVKNILESGCFNINRGAYEGSYEMASLVYETREKIARFFDVPSGRNVVFTSGATQSINIALKGLLHSGDHVVTTQMEHNAVVRPLAQLHKQGVNVDVVQCGRDGKLDIADFESKITDKTKLVAMLHASNVCGTILPIRDVGEICRRHGALLMVDAAQTAGILPISMENDNIDILVFAGHKGLLAMQGIGCLILSQQIANEITPLIAGGTGSHSHISDMPEELPDRLEAGTLNLPGIVSLSAALDYITDVGLENIYAHEKSLLARLSDGLSDIQNVRIIGPESLDDKCAIGALDFVGRDNAKIAALLDEQYGIMTRCGLHCAPGAHKALGTFPHGVVRCSFGHKNTYAEVDKLLAAISQIIR